MHQSRKKPLVGNYIRELWEQHKVKEVLELSGEHKQA